MRAVAIVLAVLVGLIVMVSILIEMYGQCGSPCWQGLLHVHRAFL
jgi:hypothetical protein